MSWTRRIMLSVAVLAMAATARGDAFLLHNGAYTVLPNFIFPNGINNAGQIVGRTPSSGVIYQNGVFTDFNVPGAAATLPQGIDNTGRIVGSYNSNARLIGFEYDHGALATVDLPDSILNELDDVNDVGTSVGVSYPLAGGVRGLIYANGIASTLEVPFGSGTHLTGINNAGQMTGYFSPFFGPPQGFVYQNGVFQFLAVPGALNTRAYDINNSGQIVGEYQSGDYAVHAFLYAKGAFTTLDFPNSYGTSALAINDLGDIVGTFTPGRSSVPEPASIVLVAGALGVLGGCARARSRGRACLP